MAASLNQIAFNIAEAVGEAKNTVLINRIKFMVEYYRALLLRRDVDRGVHINDSYVEEHTFQLTELSTITDCDNAEIAAGFEYIQSCASGGDGSTATSTLHVTTTQVPTPINLKGTDAFISVTSPGNGIDFQYVKKEQVFFSLQSRYTAAMPKYYYLGGYIYVVNAPSDCINVRLISESPTTGTGSCINPNDDFPITLDMVQRVTQAILSTELRGNTSNDDEEVKLQ